MKKIHSSLPPLSSLKNFETAARHLNMRRAAEELHVTPSAVSKQIKQLEEFLACTLFIRTGNQLALTESGKTYLNEIQNALHSIAAATEAMKNQNRTLRINALPTFSSHWLSPRLSQFQKRHPEISLKLTIGDDETIDFQKLKSDILIRCSRDSNPWPQYTCEEFIKESLLAVCAPALKNGAHPIRTLHDLHYHPILEHSTRPHLWNELLEKNNSALSPKSTIALEHFFMLIHAAKEGLGVALIPEIFIQEELKRGELCVAFPTTFTHPYRYFLICEKPFASTRLFQNFREWLSAQFI